MAAIVHGWCGFVEKSKDVVSQQMVLNKLFIPDVLIDIIKDYLYIGKYEVLRKFYRKNINRGITGLSISRQVLVDIYGRQRLALWQSGSYILEGEALYLQGAICIACGDCSQSHDNINGCCSIIGDIDDDEPIVLSEEIQDVPIPSPSVQSYSCWQKEIDDANDEYEREQEMAYREMEMVAFI